MFKKRNLLAALLLLSTAGGLVACGETSSEPTVDNEFEQNTDESMFEEASMYVIGSHWNNWDPATIKEAEQYPAETTFNVKPTLWERIKNSKLVRAIRYIMKIKVVLELPEALPAGRGENISVDAKK